ncbi:hypothetical protein [Streptomyces sp. NPDC090022]|uniref:hypothetical protein n=1 Tax=Streptomyces sp. NPDC090022 TaxID=3365920 RepID=UPI0038192A1C
MIDDERAARNNAGWCDAVCRAHGLPGAFGATVWSSPRRTPPLYPDAVTLSPAATAAEVLAGIDTVSPGCSVKDSFAGLDLTPAGFEVLFEARWIHRPAGPPVAGPPAGWRRVRTPQELTAWEAAWSGAAPAGLFRPQLLSPDTAFLYAAEAGRVTAGAAVHRTGPVVGLSNVFAVDDAHLDAAWSGVLAAVAAHWPGLPVVGYESGDDLAVAVRHGFAPAGPLRVWLHTTR